MDKESLKQGIAIKRIVYNDIKLWVKRKKYISASILKNELKISDAEAFKFIDKLKEDKIIDEKGNKIINTK